MHEASEPARRPHCMRDSDRSALRAFDDLPASAQVRLPVVCALFSISPATVWRWCKSEYLPRPIRIGGAALWNVGMLREVLHRKKGNESGLNLPRDSSAVDKSEP